MLSLDLFDSRYERDLREGAVDDLEARRIDDLNAKMDDLIARAREAKTPEHKAGLKREFDKVKDERNSYFKVRNKMMDHGSLGEAKAGYNFDAEDLKRLERIRDLPTLKAQAFELISRPSAKPMKPEKVEWFKNALEKMNSPLKVIKLMYDLLLSGEGHAVVGSKSSMNPNSYRQRFGEEETNQAGIPGNVPTEKIPGKEELLKGRGRNYYEDQKKNSDPVDEHGGGIGPRQHWQDLMQETVTDVRPLWADVYRRLAPKIERHRDSFLAGQLYDELENIAELHGAEGEFKRMMNGARNRAHMEYDTNPGGFHNWFWFLPFEDNDVAESADDIKKQMSKLEALALAANRAGDDAKCKMYQQKIQSLKQKLSQSMAEGFSGSPVTGAITRRIMSQHLDLLNQYGPELVGSAVDDVADYVGDVDEIGSSDVSGWVAQVERMLRENPPEAFAEGSQDFNKVEPYYVCLAGKPVKKFDYYQDARRFHDNWKQKLYREGNKAKADKVTLMPVIDEGIKKSAVATALAACIAAGGTLSGCATNPSVGGAIGTVRDVGTAAKTASTMTRAGVQDELSQELRNFIRAQGGDPGGQNLSLLYKLQKRMQGQKDSQPINEVKDTEAVEQAILKRIMVAHRDMLVQYGPEKIMTAASDVAYNVGDIGEMGSSDVSGWVKQVKQILGVDA